MQRGVPVLAVEAEEDRIVLGTGAWQRTMWLTTTTLTSHHGARIAADKAMTKQVLARIGIPVPIGYPVQSLEDAITIAGILGYPVVLKPRKGNKGILVFIELADERELRSAWEMIAGAQPRGGVLIEEFLPGEEYRVLVIDGRVVAVNHRIPPFVIGDGVSTIQQLVDRENARPERAPPRTGGALIHIKVDEQTVELLARSSRTLASVLPEGERQLIRRTSNASGGGSTEEVTDLMHPDNVLICELTAKTVGLDIAGIDLVVRDVSESVLETGGGILEINSGPGLIDHLKPGSGTPRDVGGAILDMLYPRGAHVRAPIVVVTGDQRCVALSRAIATCLSDEGRRIGMLVEGCFMVGSLSIDVSMMEPSGQVHALLANPLVEAAIICLPPDLLEPLPYIDVAVVSNPDSGSAAAPPAVPEPDVAWVAIGTPLIPSGTARRVITLSPTATPEEVAREVAALLGA
ncbi:MAG: ATP-grasp domain-containing protein [Thermomicrobiales bacterium]|nr:ATP-grasp domain-containing protein [Thermomicrobiales bacterium]